MSVKSDKRAYAAHWDGSECSECGGEVCWVDSRDLLVCRCKVRTAMGVYLGDIP